MRMSLSYDEIKHLIFLCLNEPYETLEVCEIGLKLITHLPLEMQQKFNNAKKVFENKIQEIESTQMIGYEEEMWIAQHYMK